MCSGSKCELCPHTIIMEGEVQKQKGGMFYEASLLLEFAASDDIESFKLAVEEHHLGVNEASLWYGRRIGSNKMSLEERTPLLIASMFGSTKVVEYILGTNKVDVNRFCGSDKATPLHCAASGGSSSSVETVKLLIDASADINSVDANGNKPINLIARNLKSSNSLRRRTLEMLLRGANGIEESSFPPGWVGQGIEVEELPTQFHQLAKEGSDKKEYPIDVPLPDINTGVYGSDEFRMYSFKVKPCSRAYSHDWTECPFAHPGENARRRDPRKHFYSCVPCPEFRKGTCAKGDSCEYAHGVFESWLHPAQYRTRLCKDETGCARKVCFFAHKTEELRPLYASTGSAMPSPKSHSSSVLDMSALSPLSLGSSPSMMPATSTPPMSPSSVSSSPMAGSMWQNKVNLTPPALQLPGSRLKAALNARDFELEMEFLDLRNQQHQRQQLIDELSGHSSPSSWSNARIGELKPTNLDDYFGAADPSLLSQLQALSPNVGNTQLQSPSANQMRQNMNQMRASYPTNGSSSPVRKSSMYGFDSSGAVASAVMNSRSAAFAKRSQSFIDRGAMNYHGRSGGLGLTAAANSASMMSSNLSSWGSPDGKLDWGYQGEDMSNKLKKSASFQYRSGSNNGMQGKATMGQTRVDEPDVSWVNTLVKDVPRFGTTQGGLYSSEQKNGGLGEVMPPWLEQMYIEQEQMQMAA